MLILKTLSLMVQTIFPYFFLLLLVHIIIINTLNFLFIFTGRPFSLQNCTVSNQSSDSLHVECVEGFNGGLPQGFILELLEMPSSKQVRNLSLMVSTIYVYILFIYKLEIHFRNFLLSKMNNRLSQERG